MKIRQIAESFDWHKSNWRKCAIVKLQKSCKKGRVQKTWKSMVLRRGRGSARVVKEPSCSFEKYFCQKPFRISLRLPKHVLHLVLSAGVRKALKVARIRILGKGEPVLIIKEQKSYFGLSPETISSKNSIERRCWSLVTII